MVCVEGVVGSRENFVVCRNMDDTSLEDKITKGVATFALGFLAVGGVLGMGKTLALLGIGFGVVGTFILIFGELKRGAAWIRFSSSQSCFEYELGKEPWYRQVVVRLTDRFFPSSRKPSDLVRDLGEPPVFEDYPRKVYGFVFLLGGFLLQLARVFD